MRKFLISTAAIALLATTAISTEVKAEGDPVLGGAIVGGAAGAAIGGAATRNVGGAAAGAIIGGATGAAIGSSMARPERVRVCFEDDWGRRRCRWERRY